MEIAFHESIGHWNRNPYTALESDYTALESDKKNIKTHQMRSRVAIAAR